MSKENSNEAVNTESSGNQDTPGTPEGHPYFEIECKIVEALKTIYDPEIPVNIYELGLIYTIGISKDPELEGLEAAVQMTLTAPGCPVADELFAEVQQKVESVEEIERAIVELVFEPPWNPSMMSEAARLSLGMDNMMY